MLARVEKIGKSPLCELPPCDSDKFGAALRIMLAVLPRKQSDEVSGELFVRAYERALGDKPTAAIEWLSEEAIKRCRWFPTVAECLDILSGWRRNDCDVQRKMEAQRIANKERSARSLEVLSVTYHDPSRDPMTQADVDAMPEALQNIGLAKGWLERDRRDRVILAPDEP